MESSEQSECGLQMMARNPLIAYGIPGAGSIRCAFDLMTADDPNASLSACYVVKTGKDLSLSDEKTTRRQSSVKAEQRAEMMEQILDVAEELFSKPACGCRCLRRRDWSPSAPISKRSPPT